MPPTISLTSMPVSSQTPLPTTTWLVTPPQPCSTQPPAQLSASLLSTILPISLSEERSSYFIDEPPIPLTPTGDPITATSTPSSPVFSSEVSPAVGIDTFDLPPFPPLDLDQVFTWGSTDGISFTKDLDDAYTAVVRWKRNLFKVPFGNLGRNFVSELARLFREYANNSALESVALKAAMTMPSLLLQRPHNKSKEKENTACLERRLSLWCEGDISTLLKEGQSIQDRLKYQQPSRQEKDHRAQTFGKLVMQGKVREAIRLLSDSPSSGILLPTDTCQATGQSVRDVLAAKHPTGQAVVPSEVFSSSIFSDLPHPVIFDSLTGALVKSIAMSSSGAAGPSGADAADWRRFCSCFKRASEDLCTSLAAVAKKLCTQLIDPKGTSSLVASRLIALDKNPGVRPIGIGEVSRRIINKAILRVLHHDIQEAAGSLQLCAGQLGGCEAAIHAARSMFSSQNCEGILLVDASNAFNSLNRQLALINISHLCPPISQILINTYRSDSLLFCGEETFLSSEGTTQGDPLAMAMYALAVVPLINRLYYHADQIWYADDASASGSISQLREWWDALNEIGPSYGYFPNANKTHLVVKPEFFDAAKQRFEGSSVKITDQGHRYLGSAIGQKSFVESFTNSCVNEWIKEVHQLSTFAESQPHAAFAALTHGLIGKWMFLARTTPDIAHLFEPLESTIRCELIPRLTGQGIPGTNDRDLFSLPARLGGMGITNPVEIADSQYNNSKDVSGPLVDLLQMQNCQYSADIYYAQQSVKSDLKSSKRAALQEKANSMQESFPEDLRLAVKLAQEKGASIWLTALPIAEHDFALHKSAFRDALALRYGWTPTRLPLKCVCGSDFVVEHALNCPRGGLPSQRHNELRNLTAALLSEVCNDVATEPELQPLSGENLHYRTAITTDGARLDVKAQGFWGSTNTKDYFDVKVFNPYAKSYRKRPQPQVFSQLEQSKRRAYEERIRDVEHGTFTPLIFSATGGLGRAATVTYRRLASQLADKWMEPYGIVMGWLRCQISFSLIRSAIACLRNSRVSHYYHNPHSLHLIMRESQI